MWKADRQLNRQDAKDAKKGNVMANPNRRINRREFIKQTALASAGVSLGLNAKPARAVRRPKARFNPEKKVIVIGVDGMDPNLSMAMMKQGRLPNFDRLRKMGGFHRLGTSIPPQSPVAWANFINGAGPGSHGIFDFIHRNPEKQCAPFYSAAETVPSQGGWQVGDHKIPVEFWPFNHRQAETVLRRQGTPFWDYLDAADVRSVFYDLPSNFPPSPSVNGNHQCLAGMGTTDLLGTYGTYQHFSEDGPVRTKEEGGGRRTMIFFEDETAKIEVIGPRNDFLVEPKPTYVEMTVHRDKKARAAVMEVCGQRILLKEGEWSRWLRLGFTMSMPPFMPDETVHGICRMYLQEVVPNFRVYVSPINVDPSDPATRITEPHGFIRDLSEELGLFYTTGFQEAYKALSNGVFSDEEFVVQADHVLQERLNLLDYAVTHYDEGLLFFYFSSTDLQAHMLWWDSPEKHPTRSDAEAKRYFNVLKGVYEKIDGVLGDILKRYHEQATIIVISDHGFARFKRQFNVNTWLRQNGYIQAPDARSVMYDVDWSRTKAYGLGINSLYLNLKGRERDGIVEPGREQEALIQELIVKLKAVRDMDGRPVIREVHRTDKAYAGAATGLAPDLVLGYYRGFRASWATCLGDMTDAVLLDNDNAWSADHCADVMEVPGVIFSNRPIKSENPRLVDVAPSILTRYGMEVPGTMEGRNIFG